MPASQKYLEKTHLAQWDLDLIKMRGQFNIRKCVHVFG